MELILIVLIIIMAASAYGFGYQRFAKKADEIEQKNVRIEKENQNLESRLTNKPRLEQGIAKAVEKRREILKAYSGGTTIEKYLVILTEFEDTPKIVLNSGTYSPDSPWMTSSVLDEEGNPRETIQKSVLSIGYYSEYEQLKRFIDYLHNNKEKFNVESLTASGNDEYELISGNMTIAVYTAVDEDHEYEPPVIEGLDIGKQNIFN